MSNLRFREVSSRPWERIINISRHLEPRPHLQPLPHPPRAAGTERRTRRVCHGSCGKFSCMNVSLPWSKPGFCRRLIHSTVPHRKTAQREEQRHRHHSKISATVKCQEPAWKVVSWQRVSWYQSPQHAPEIRGSSCAPDCAPLGNRMKKTDTKECTEEDKRVKKSQHAVCSVIALSFIWL